VSKFGAISTTERLIYIERALGSELLHAPTSLPPGFSRGYAALSRRQSLCPPPVSVWAGSADGQGLHSPAGLDS